MQYSFSVDSFKKFWELTQITVNEYLSDDLNESKAIEAATKLWHMCDWYFREFGNKHGYTQLSQLQGDFGAACASLKVMRDVANGSKHAGIDRGKPIIQRASKHNGDFNADFSRDFNVSVLEVKMSDGTIRYFDDCVKEALDYWKLKCL